MVRNASNRTPLGNADKGNYTKVKHCRPIVSISTNVITTASPVTGGSRWTIKGADTTYKLCNPGTSRTSYNLSLKGHQTENEIMI
jgi:hypothetical protein